jgi:hypothetical protein
MQITWDPMDRRTAIRGHWVQLVALANTISDRVHSHGLVVMVMMHAMVMMVMMHAIVMMVMMHAMVVMVMMHPMLVMVMMHPMLVMVMMHPMLMMVMMHSRGQVIKVGTGTLATTKKTSQPPILYTSDLVHTE